jgi:hypothetical protein
MPSKAIAANTLKRRHRQRSKDKETGRLGDKKIRWRSNLLASQVYSSFGRLTSMLRRLGVSVTINPKMAQNNMIAQDMP